MALSTMAYRVITNLPDLNGRFHFGTGNRELIQL